MLDIGPLAIPCQKSANGEAVPKIMETRLIMSPVVATHVRLSSQAAKCASGVSQSDWFPMSGAEKRSPDITGVPTFLPLGEVAFQNAGEVWANRDQTGFVELGSNDGENVILEVHVIQREIECFADS